VDYFQAAYITIDLRRLHKSSGWQYGYKVSDTSITIIKDPVFDTPTLAYADALELAFRCREQFLLARQQGQVTGKQKRKGLHRRTKLSGIKVLLRKGDILYRVVGSTGQRISEDEICVIPETGFVKRYGKELSVGELLELYKVFLESL